MDELLGTLIVIVIGVAGLIWHNNNKKQADKLGITAFTKASYLSGIGDFNQGVDVNIFCYEDKIGFDDTTYGDRDIALIMKADLLKKAKLTDEKSRNQGIVSNETIKYVDNYQLPYKRIKRVDLKSVQQMTEKQKSVLMRGIAGGVLAGGVGAVLGGMTGLKNEREQSEVQILSIDYITKDREEITALFAMIPKDFKSYQVFKKTVSFIMNKIEQDIKEEAVGTQEI